MNFEGVSLQFYPLFQASRAPMRRDPDGTPHGAVAFCFTTLVKGETVTNELTNSIYPSRILAINFHRSKEDKLFKLLN